MAQSCEGRGYVDVDAALVTAHSDKEQAAGTFKGSYGFHPLLAYLHRGDGTGEALAGLLRPGNAARYTVADHVEVAGTALIQLDLADEHTVVLRADAGGSPRDFLTFLRDAEIGFTLSVPVSEDFRAAIRTLHADPRAWTLARR